MDTIQGLFWLLAIVLFYFLPWIVAVKRMHRSATAIGVTNLLLGWTGLGWVVALIWSFTGYVYEEEV